MSKQQIAWIVFVLALVMPPALHFLINFYWWLFDGNVLNIDKMFASGFMTFLTGFTATLWAGTTEVWHE